MYQIFNADGFWIGSAMSQPSPDTLGDGFAIESDYLSGDGTMWADPKTKQMRLIPHRTDLHQYWDGSAWVLSAEQQAVKKAQDIAIVRERINALRDSKSAGGVYVEALGKWFDSDDKAQKKLLGLKATMDLMTSEMTVDWTCADNTDFEGFGKPHLTAVIATILQTENHNHTVARQHKVALEQAENPLEYDYSGGWSKTYQEFLNEQNQ